MGRPVEHLTIPKGDREDVERSTRAHWIFAAAKGLAMTLATMP